MDEAELLASAREILQRAADALYALAGPSAFELAEEVLTTEIDRPERRTRCFAATAVMALLPPDCFEHHPPTLDGSSALAEAQRIVDGTLDELLVAWGEADQPAREDERDEHPADTIRTSVWLLLDFERPRRVREDDDTQDDDGQDDATQDDATQDDDAPADVRADESPLERAHGWFDRMFHHDD